MEDFIIGYGFWGCPVCIIRTDVKNYQAISQKKSAMLGGNYMIGGREEISSITNNIMTFPEEDIKNIPIYTFEQFCKAYDEYISINNQIKESEGILEALRTKKKELVNNFVGKEK